MALEGANPVTIRPISEHWQPILAGAGQKEAIGSNRTVWRTDFLTNNDVMLPSVR